MKLNRKNKLLIGLCTAAAILIAKLFSIQIIDDKYKLASENNSLVYNTIYPNRGIINDRNGKILVGNKVAYDLMITPDFLDAAAINMSSFESLKNSFLFYSLFQ